MIAWYWALIAVFVSAVVGLVVGFVAGGTCAVGKRDDEERMRHQIRDINDGTNWHGRRGA